MKLPFATITLAEVVDTYCASSFNNDRKHYENYLIHGRAIWEELLKDTPFSIRHKIVKVIRSRGYAYIEVPKDNWRILGISLKDEKGKFVNVPEDDTVAIAEEPTSGSSACGCKKCGCETSLCGQQFQVSKKPVRIDNVVYEEITWRKIERNGNVLKVRRFPTKDFTTSNHYTIKWVEEESRLCCLKVKPCGCIDMATPQNRYLLTWHGCQPKEKKIEWRSCGPFTYKRVGNRIYLANAGTVSHVILSYQSNGRCDAEEILVPEPFSDALQFGIHYRAAALSGTRRLDVRELKKEYYQKKNDLYEFLQPIRITDFLSLQGIFEWGGFGPSGCMINLPCAPANPLEAFQYLCDALDEAEGDAVIEGGDVVKPDNDITPDDLEYIIGETGGAPIAGQTTFVLPTGEGYYIRLFRTGDKQSFSSADFAYNTATKLLTVRIPWEPGELIQIEFTKIADVEVEVGSDGGPASGAVSFVFSGMTAKTVLYRNRVRQSVEAGDYLIDVDTKQLLFTYPLEAGEIIGLESYTLVAPTYQVGVTAGAPTEGESDFLLSAAHKVRLYRDRIKQSRIRGDWAYSDRRVSVEIPWIAEGIVQFEYY